ncbi:hypothetical protein NEOC95_002225 [Neochlamydia sp. AcF95]|nr:hypothetical protein [Neochlamydia sp. AcF95]
MQPPFLNCLAHDKGLLKHLVFEDFPNLLVLLYYTTLRLPYAEKTLKLCFLGSEMSYHLMWKI